MAKPFLILQLRPEDEASDDELAAFMKFGGLKPSEVRRIRMEQQPMPDIDLADYAGVIIGGGPSNVSDDEAAKSPAQRRFESELRSLLTEVIERDFPLLGACYGLGILAIHLGGTVSKEKYSEEVGAITIKLTADAQNDPLTTGLPPSFRAFAGHKEACQDLPPGAALLAGSETCPIQMIRVKKNIYATQFHTELDQAGLALRINIYKDAGYFPPQDADKLIEAARAETVTVPEIMLRRFVERGRHLNP
ncbi:MAG TPA: glutamine amidotransferase [Candidatus Saccharimonadales bacterium]|nr:glutamine amidotransferase [Candidatus Saccharimonadales bacterium]